MLRRSTVLVPLLASTSSFTPVACDDGAGGRYGAGTHPAGADGETGGERPPPEDMEEMYARAGEEFQVPWVLLQAVARVETGEEHVQGMEEFEGLPPATGVMGMRGDNLEEGSSLAGVTVDDARDDAFANIRAAAALLSAWADEEGIADRMDLPAWQPVLARYSGIEDPEGRDYYVYMEVMAEVADLMDPQAAKVPWFPATDRFDPQTAPGPDYPPAIWRPSPNYSSRPGGGGGDPHMVIIHACEGSYAGCWSWLKNPSSGVSAHYVVNKTGSEITQLVREAKKAWHIAAKYNCSRNDGHECWRNNASSNNFTIGIEHAGYTNQASWNPGLIDASAKLLCDIAGDHDIPIDKYHVVGHGQLQPWNRDDPGPNWPWTSYRDLASSYCGGNPPPPPDPDPDPPPAGSCVHSFGGVYSHGACSAAYQCCDGKWEVVQGSCGACTCTEPTGHTGCDGQAPPPPPPPDPNDPLEIVIDSSNANNGPAAQFEASQDWWSAGGPTQYGTGYYWQSTWPKSDPARFSFKLDAPRTLVVEAWWTSGGNRSPNAPYVVFDADDNVLGTVYVDQSKDGGTWVSLGTFDFTAGWNTVALSVWTTKGYVVVADAVRVRSP